MSKNNIRRWGRKQPKLSKGQKIIKGADFGRILCTVAHSHHNHIGFTGSLEPGGRDRMYHATRGWRTRRSVV